MEKCTYCVQRINAARIAGRSARTATIRDGEIVTACQAACPTEAIVFGNINDPNSRVAQAEGEPAQLRAARGAQHAAAHHVSGGGAQSEPGAARNPTVGEHDGGRTRRQRGQRTLMAAPSRSIDRRRCSETPVDRCRVTTSRRSPTRSRRFRCRSGPRSAGSSASSIALRAARHGLHMALGYLVLTGIGIWGNNIPVGWAFDIINFVWWIGIGHAGTLISAILLLFRQQWRTSINRFAEAMTLFAVACAAIFPLFHTGRPWLAAYWLFPYPNTMGLWPQFRSPLIWDVFAVSTYATVSVALLVHRPDSRPRDAARSRARRRSSARIYGMLSLGWRGSARHWQRYEMAYLLLAGLSTPLVLSVHTVVSASTSRSRCCPAGTPRSSRPTSSPAPSTPASRWC